MRVIVFAAAVWDPTEISFVGLRFMGLVRRPRGANLLAALLGSAIYLHTYVAAAASPTVSVSTFRDLKAAVANNSVTHITVRRTIILESTIELSPNRTNVLTIVGDSASCAASGNTTTWSLGGAQRELCALDAGGYDNYANFMDSGEFITTVRHFLIPEQNPGLTLQGLALIGASTCAVQAAHIMPNSRAHRFSCVWAVLSKVQLNFTLLVGPRVQWPMLRGDC